MKNYRTFFQKKAAVTLIAIISLKSIHAQKVGIGSTQFTPTNTLDVKGNMSIGTNYTGIATAAPSNGLLVEGNVGIGTFSPLTKLYILDNNANSTNIVGNSTNSIGLVINNTIASGRSWSLFSSGSLASGPAPVGSFGIYDNNVFLTRMVIDPNGNMGIGSHSPTAKLDVYGTITNGIRYIKNAADARITLGDHTKSWSTAVGWGTAGDYSIIEEGVAGDRFYIKQGGNVGISTSNPGQKLEIVETNFNATTQNSAILIGGGASANGNFTPSIGFKTSNGGNVNGKAAISGVQLNADNDVMGLAFFVHQSGTAADALREAMRINENGNVGIGITSPAELLHVKATTGANDAKMIIQSGGEGNDSHLVLSTGFGGDDYRKTGIVADGITSWSRSDLHFVLNNAANTNSYTVGTDTRMIIKNGGSVGIGTTIPGLATPEVYPGLNIGTGRTTLSVNGAAGIGSIELTSNSADADFAGLGILNWVDKSRTPADGSTDNRSACIAGFKQGTTANKRGGHLAFYVLGNNSNAVVTAAMGIDANAFVNLNSVNAVQYAYAKYQLSVYGPGQNTANMTNAGNKAGAILISDANGFTAGYGGALLFGANNGTPTANVSAWAAIKALYTAGSGETAAGDLAFSTRNASGDANLTERMRLLANGNFGIGTTNPATRLDVRGAGTAGANLDLLTIMNTESSYNANGGAGIVATYGGGHPLFRISGNIQNGGSGDASYMAFSTNTAATLTEKARILSNGNFGIGTDNPSQKLHVAGNICYTGSIGACSDIRYKTNFKPLTNALENVMRMKGVSYNWKVNDFPGNNFTPDSQIGFIAQDLEKIYPEVVLTDNKGYKSVDYGKLTAVLVEAMKEQQKVIDELKLHNTKQDVTIESLKSQLNSAHPITGNAK